MVFDDLWNRWGDYFLHPTFYLLTAVILLYFLPVFIACLRSHRFVISIGAINFFLGWTVFGWWAVLLWSINGDVDKSA